MYKEYWEKGLLRGGMNSFQGLAHRNAVPEEMAWPMLFLNSSMASYITAQALYIDYGNIILNKLGLMK
jgi:NAD(P)-dependent dehydrogenase (short-subunit alcohol dehydrogenase family)